MSHKIVFRSTQQGKMSLVVDLQCLIDYFNLFQTFVLVNGTEVFTLKRRVKYVSCIEVVIQIIRFFNGGILYLPDKSQ